MFKPVKFAEFDSVKADPTLDRKGYTIEEIITQGVNGKAYVYVYLSWTPSLNKVVTRYNYHVDLDYTPNILQYIRDWLKFKFCYKPDKEPVKVYADN